MIEAEAEGGSKNGAVAIIGMSFRFGGEAESTEGFWQMLLEAQCVVSPVPADRFNSNAFYHPDTNRLDRLPVRSGNFLTEDIAAFDAPFFNIKAAEAAAMDPQSRKLLEATYHALETAGLPIEKVAGTRTCVFTGISSDDYRLMYAKDTSYPIRHAATGMGLSMLANKISWFYDLKGPSVQLDTACSASLHAVHLAVRSVQSGESEMGIVGGANLFFTPDSMAPLAHMNFFSPDSRCFSFDRRANGYSRGEGYGVFVLKPLVKAIQDGDPIRAVIAATAANENGRTVGGITKVNLKAQQALVREAYKAEGVDPSHTRYVEAHAPGTQGDIVETSALASVFSPHRSHSSPLYMGSVKANVGHLEGSSGVASLAKVVLMLERGMIPKLANFQTLHPEIKDKDWNMAFPTETVPWPPGPRQASINSFGFGGANAHLVLQCFEGNEALKAEPSDVCDLPTSILMTLSAADQASMKRLQSAMQIYTMSRRNFNTRADMMDMAYTMNARRSRLAWKSSLVIDIDSKSTESSVEIDWSALTMPLRSFIAPELVFVFTGQGTAWTKMGTQFLYNATFLASLERFSQTLSYLNASWDIIKELKREADTSRVKEAEFSQPLCTAIQIALIDMLRSFGLFPKYVIGHSSGEIAAAYTVGALSADMACKLAYLRGRIAARHFGQSNDHGMLVVGLSVDDVEEYLADAQESENSPLVYVACINSPCNVTLSGKWTDLNQLQSRLEERGVFTRRLQVTVPYHSPILAEVAAEYEVELGMFEQAVPNNNSAQMISTVTGRIVSSGELCLASYWVRNLLSPVRFEPAVNTLLTLSSIPQSTSNSTSIYFVDIGPHGALRTAVRDSVSTANIALDVKYLSTMDRNVLTATRLFTTLGELHCAGCEVDLNAVNALSSHNPRCLSDLPPYPFDHSRKYWHESQRSINHRFRKHARHDLLGTRAHDWNQLQPRWQNRIRVLENPWIDDHRLAGALIYPGAGMLVMAVEAVAQYLGDIVESPISAFCLTNILLQSPLHLSTHATGTEVEFSLIPSSDTIEYSKVPTRFHFQIYLRDDSEWREVCHGNIAAEFMDIGNSSNIKAEKQHQNASLFSRFQESLSQCSIPVGRHKLYRSFHRVGLDLGTTFQVFDNVMRSPRVGFATAQVRLQNWRLTTNSDHASPHYIHPTALDGAIQLPLVALGAGSRPEPPTMIPSAIKRLWISAQGLSQPGSITATAQSEYIGLRHTRSTVLAFDIKSHEPKIVAEGLETIIIKGEDNQAEVEEPLTTSHIKWVTSEDTSADVSDLLPISSVNVISFPHHTNGDVATETLEEYVNTTLANLGLRVTRILPDGNNQTVSSFAPNDDKSSCVVLTSTKNADITTADEIFRFLKTIVSTSGKILWITVSCASVSAIQASFHGLVVGFSRAIRAEYPGLRFRTLEIDQDLALSSATELIVKVLRIQHTAMDADEQESEYRAVSTEAGPRLYVPRLIPSDTDFDRVNYTVKDDVVTKHSLQSSLTNSLKLMIKSPGLIDTLIFAPVISPTVELGAEQVIIKPAYVGLNFLDVLTALGRIPQNSVLGIEASGIVVEAGAESDLQEGDRVAVLADGTFQTRLTTNFRNAIRLPDSVTLADAASMTGTASTAYRALVDVGRLRKGESVLIHAGAGATGQMSIQLAAHIGATIFVTVGSEAKRRVIKQTYGIPDDHIFASRDVSFVDAILRKTHHVGVDVVLNSASGDLLHHAWAKVVAPFGRWIEIGKKDIMENKGLSMSTFLNNVTFSCIDLTGIWRQRPALMRRLLQDVFKLVSDGVLRPPSPVAMFKADDVQAAFRALQSGTHSGKVIVDMCEGEMTVHEPPQRCWRLRSDASYLVVGGFGGLGREVVRYLVSKSARFIVIITRSAIISPGPRQALVEEVANAGCKLHIIVCDIGNKAAVQKGLQDCGKVMPTIAGCIQASMLLKDRYFKDMTQEEWSLSIASKVMGSSNLDELLPHGMDFFVLFSSLVGVIGAVGQSNYAAGNAFQDMVARSRIKRGERAFSLDLSLIIDEGAVSEADDLFRTMESYGHYQLMTMSNIEALLDHYCDPALPLLAPEECQLVCGIRPPSVLKAKGFTEPRWMIGPMHSILKSKDRSTASSVPRIQEKSLQTLLRTCLSLDEASRLITEHFAQKLSASLGMSIHDIDTSRPIHLYGVDSLVAVELRNWFVNTLRADISTLSILDNNSVEGLAKMAAHVGHYTGSLVNVK